MAAEKTLDKVRKRIPDLPDAKLSLHEKDRRYLLALVDVLVPALRDEMTLVEALIAKATKRAFAIPTDAHARAKLAIARCEEVADD